MAQPALTVWPQMPHTPVGGTSTKQSGQTARGRSTLGVRRGARSADDRGEEPRADFARGAGGGAGASNTGTCSAQ